VCNPDYIDPSNGYCEYCNVQASNPTNPDVDLCASGYGCVGDETQATGTPGSNAGTTAWGTGSTYCMSDLNVGVDDPTIVDAGTCWTFCLGAYPDSLVAIDFSGEDGNYECYCQDDCRCMEEY
jgi:hypothetical protein